MSLAGRAHVTLLSAEEIPSELKIWAEDCTSHCNPHPDHLSVAPCENPPRPCLPQQRPGALLARSRAGLSGSCSHCTTALALKISVFAGFYLPGVLSTPLGNKRGRSLCAAPNLHNLPRLIIFLFPFFQD